MQQAVEFTDPNEEPIILQYPDFQVFVVGSDHTYYCKCPICHEWWLGVGPEEDGKFGPFGLELWDEYAEKYGGDVEQVKLRFASAQFVFGDVNIFPDLFSDEQLEEYFRLHLMPEEENEDGN